MRIQTSFVSKSTTYVVLVFLRSKILFGRKLGFFGVDAEVGFGNTPLSIEAGKGGVCLWLAPRLSHLISSSGQARGGRAQWIRFSRLPGGDVAVLNVYASNCARDRCEF